MSSSDSNYHKVTINKVTKWVDGKLHSFITNRPSEFKFKAGQFARLGLPVGHGVEPTIWRGFSMVNPEEADYLEFYATLVPTGEFSPKLFALDEGESIAIQKVPFGFLTLDNFPNGGKTLWLFATGTGLSAFLSILQTQKTWELFSNVVLCHGVRTAAELSYEDLLLGLSQKYLHRFTYLPLPTRESEFVHPWSGALMPSSRITKLIEDGDLVRLSELDMNSEDSCIMLCGNPEMLSEARALLKDRGFATGRRGAIGNLAVEKYW